ncbi:MULTISPECIES: cation:proton antiporter [unclassified Methanoregula]|uniref:cation:proton antiporter domain-containing protein n=1 Tax=unclassified Methanoregula TaxID=2649730 RepID=UPI0009CA5F45|nr:MULTISPECIES: cation:proton antiporter [unclassified Methanoregula]OPX64687.1 MAG: Calcium-gated potassium channel MthK [Methanoregula sp. PtaB.Bin085]OPY36055.1 MAG: Calcium-gated potassium channel MthK [Methanoregula sp. PtaU1.Bin006]
MAFGLLTNILIVFAIALAVGMLFDRIRVPPLVAFILTGVIVGPYGLSLIQEQSDVTNLAELGIILLLFTIGLEFSFRDLWKIRSIAIVGGALQVVLSFAFFCGFAIVMGLPPNQAILMGFLFSLSSTAIVLKILHQRGEIDSPHGSIALGILIFQDLAAIPMIMAIPFLASIPQISDTPFLSIDSLISLVITDLVIVLVLIALAKWVVPRVMHEIAKTRNQELFLLVVILTCFGIAWMVTFTGVSLAIGALLAGLIISGSEYSHQATSIILPFRDIFTSFFFISVGMLVDIRFFAGHFWFVAFLICIAIVAKALLATAAPLALGYPLRTAVITGLALAQVGEFSFIIAQGGFNTGILPAEIYQVFLIVALMTMAATPFVIALGNPVTGRLCSMPAMSRIARGTCSMDDDRKSPPKKDHLVIIGYGVTGRNLARTAANSGITYSIIELNPDLVRAARAEGESVIFGDATSEGVLAHAGISTARIAVVAIDDPVATRKIVGICRRLNPALSIIVRTRYVSEAQDLQAIGADEVIAQEFETSVEIFTVVLNKYFVPRSQIESFISDIRADGYQMLRSRSPQHGTLPDLMRHIPHVTITSMAVEPGSPLDGVTLGEVSLRKQTNLLVLAIRRGNDMITGLSGETRLLAGDIAIIYATPEDIARGARLFSRKDGA